MAYSDELRTELAQAKYDGIMAEPEAVRNEYLAALMNAPVVEEIENPDPQGKIVAIPTKLSAVTSLLTPAENKAVMVTPFSGVFGDAAEADPDAFAVLVDFLDENEETVDIEAKIGTVARLVIESRNVPAITALIQALAATGVLSTATAVALRDSMYIDDPSWTPAIYQHSKSIARLRWNRYVQPADVAEALA